MMHKKWILYAGFLLIISCNSAVYDQYQPIENQEWTFDNNIEFIVENIDTISKKNVFINIRNNKNYEYSTLYLIAKIQFPKGVTVVDTLGYEMTDAEGYWLGTGFSDVKENKLFYKENVVFNEQGNYKFSIQQATRGIRDIEGKNPLNGIIDVGLSIEKVQ
jgi:gliding motility-associated lipoprotein GldH